MFLDFLDSFTKIHLADNESSSDSMLREDSGELSLCHIRVN